MLWEKLSSSLQCSTLKDLSLIQLQLPLSFLSFLQELILSVIFYHLPKKRKWILDSKCFLLVKVKEKLLNNSLKMVGKMEIGFACKTAIWLSVGCLLFKKFKKIKFLKKLILTIVCG